VGEEGLTRGYEEKEMRMVIEYIAERWPGRRFGTRVRLGKVPTIKVEGIPEEKMIGFFKPCWVYADAVVWDPPILWVIEAKVDDETRAIGQLKYYLTLIEETPGLITEEIKEVKGLILLARRIPAIAEFAKREGVEIDFYLPEWLEEFLIKGYKYS